VHRDHRPPRFQRVSALDKSELEDLVHLISQRAGRCLERLGLLEQDAQSAWLELKPADDADTMPHLLLTSVSYGIAVSTPSIVEFRFWQRTVLNGEIYVLGGSVNDDSSIIGGPPLRVYFNDVWKSKDGRSWQLLTHAAPWAKRAGAELVTKGEYLYMLGGEQGFLCQPEPDCELPYFNDVWRSKDGIVWELVTASANWSARPGHQCGVIRNRFVCFGGFGLPENPVDVWVSEHGAEWQLLSSPPWNAQSGEEIKYDFDIIVTESDAFTSGPAIYTFGGDRETFDFDDPLNYLRVDNDVWRFTNPGL